MQLDLEKKSVLQKLALKSAYIPESNYVQLNYVQLIYSLHRHQTKHLTQK